MNEAVDQLEVEEAVPVAEQIEQLNEVIVILDGQEISTPMETLGVSMDSTSTQILEAVGGIIEEAEGNRDGYEDAYGDFTYTVRKVMESGIILVMPKPVAG